MARVKGSAKTPGSGRKSGTPNKIVAEIKALARQHGREAIEKLAKLMRGQDEALERLEAKIERVPDDGKEMHNLLRELLAALSGRNVQNELGAARELLDRGWGKPTQAVNLGGEVAISRIETVIVDPKDPSR